MKENRKVRSIARRLKFSWQWKKFALLLRVDITVLAVCALAFLYAAETAVTGTFHWQGLERWFTAEAGLKGMAWVESVKYCFLWQGETHIVPMLPFLAPAGMFGGGLLCLQGIDWLLGFFGGSHEARKLLRPLDEIAERAQKLSDEASKRQRWDPEKVHDLEQAIGQIDIGGTLSTGDKDLAGLENAVNDMIARMHKAYRQQAQFVSDASHELRTPLAVIQGYVNMLDRWGKTDEKVLTESIDAIKSETAHMKTLVEQLLFLARGDSGRQQFAPEDMDFKEMMLEALEEYRMIDEHHDWQEGKLMPAPVNADPALIKQAARILADNAKRYTPEGGRIRFSTGIADGCAFFEVQDSGMGIADRDIPRIFDRFYRADPARATGGTGLGLAIAKWIVERHDGYFTVQSRTDIGTRIRVHLPMTPAIS